MRRTSRLLLPVLLVAFVASLFPETLRTYAQIAPPAVELRVNGAVNTPLSLSAADLKKMPRKTISVINPHEKKQESYEGVPVKEILKRAGVPQGEQMRGSAMASYVLAEAEDGYRVVFLRRGAGSRNGGLRGHRGGYDGRRAAGSQARTFQASGPA
jgi:hypothetical protein